MSIYRAVWCRKCATAHEKYPNFEPCPNEIAAKRSNIPSPSVIVDTIEPFQSQIDGKMYDSKAAYRATLKPGGNPEGKEYVEVGNDPARHKPFKRKPPDTKANVEAIKKAQARYERGERARNRNWTKNQGTHA